MARVTRACAACSAESTASAKRENIRKHSMHANSNMQAGKEVQAACSCGMQASKKATASSAVPAHRRDYGEAGPLKEMKLTTAR